MSVKETNLIFDLDGTLFDSAPEILICLKKVIILNKLDIADEISETIIGPPLKEVLKGVIKKKDIDKIDNLIKDFIELYDSDYCLRTKLYRGVAETLKILSSSKNLILITNKRITPTKKMLRNANILDFFNKYFSVDPENQLAKDKSTLISRTIKDLDLNSKNTAYIGDTFEDFIASKQNNIKFFYAAWGYGEFVEDADLHLNGIEEML